MYAIVSKSRFVETIMCVSLRITMEHVTAVGQLQSVSPSSGEILSYILKKQTSHLIVSSAQAVATHSLPHHIFHSY